MIDTLIHAAAQFWAFVGFVAFVVILVYAAAFALAAILGLVVGLIEWIHGHCFCA